MFSRSVSPLIASQNSVAAVVRKFAVAERRGHHDEVGGVLQLSRLDLIEFAGFDFDTDVGEATLRKVIAASRRLPMSVP